MVQPRFGRSFSACSRALACALLGLAAGALPAARGQAYGLASRGSIGAYLNGAMPPVPPTTAGSWTTVNAFPNLTFQDPVALVREPGTNTFFVCGREGQIWSFPISPTASTKTLVLDLSAHCQGWSDCGLLGLAFHPQFGQAGSPNRGYVYVYYSYTPGPIVGSASAPPNNYTTPSYNRLSRFTIPDGSSVIDPNSELVLINQYDRDLWHNGGALFFGSDGFLYLTNGDEGGADDQYNQSQKIDSGLFGGVLRIDVDENPTLSHPIRRQPQSGGPPPAGWPASYSANYYIPNDNPWLDPNGGNLEEFWAIGLRSPWRMTQDPLTGQMWLSDVGQAAWEELDLIQKGGNYQWGYREGNAVGFKPMPSPLIGTDTPPIYSYSHDSGDTCAIGGYVYRGSQFSAQLGGQFIFGDNTSNRIYSLVLNGSAAPTVTYLASLPPGSDYVGGVASFGEDANNELYMCTTGQTASIYKLQIASQSGQAIPALLSQTGAFADLATLTPVNGVIPYTVNLPFWSDGAVKGRWMAVPSNAQITFSPTGEWTFPPGTVLIKNFEIGTDDTNPAAVRRLETRLIVRTANGGVYGVTYKWRADNSDADLLVGSLSESIQIATATGSRVQTWYYPSGQDCLTCHNSSANYILGVKTRQLNGSFTYPSTGTTDNQLRALNHVGLFSPALSESAIPGYAALVPASDTAASLETRVRSYLDVNCAQCHRPNGTSQAYWDARFDTPLASQGIINGPLVSDLGIPDAKVLAPASLSTSMIYLRANITGGYQMPPLARNTVDQQDVALLTSYIQSLPAQPAGNAGTDQDVTPGTAVTLQGSASNVTPGTTPTYSWSQVIGNQVTLANPNSLTPSFTAPASGTYGFTLTVTDGSSQGTSDPILVTVGSSAAPDLSTLPGDLTVSAGETALLTMEMIGVPTPTVQWLKNGQAIPGATSTFLELPNVQLSDAAVYSVVATNSVGTSTTNGETLIVNSPVAITAQPQPVAATAGGSATFTVAATGSGPLAYQWTKNGTAVAGAVYSSFTISPVGTTDQGSYACIVSNTTGSVNSNAADLTLPGPSPGRLVNLSVFGNIQGSLTMGFVTGGSGTTGPEPLLIRGVGPSIGPGTTYNVPGVMPDPVLTVVQQSTHAIVAQNSGWGSPAGNAQLVEAADLATGAFALTNPASADSAVVANLSPVTGGYSATVAGASGDSGYALTEVYDATSNYEPSNTRLINLSCLTQIPAGGTLDVGFVIGGATTKDVLVRVSGPALHTLYSLSGTMPDPQFQLQPLGGTTVLASDAGWAGNAAIAAVAASVGAFAWPTNPVGADSAATATLAPGAYTVQVTSASEQGGTVLVEIYDAP